MNIKGSGWTEAAIAFVQKHWVANRTATEISGLMKVELGIERTRNAVIGIVNRACITRDPKAPKASYRPKLAAKRMPKPKPILKPVAVDAPSLSISRDEASKAAMQRANTGGGVESPFSRPWIERKSGECKFPLGTRYAIQACCNPIERGDYCSGHASLAYVDVPYEKQRKRFESARAHARFDRVIPTDGPKPFAKPTSVWDEGRA